jgi:hypothetical protein
MKISFARKQFYHLVYVAVAWSPVRMEGNLLASEDKVLREISVPRAGRLAVLQYVKLSTYLTFRRRAPSLFEDHIDLFIYLTKIYIPGSV